MGKVTVHNTNAVQVLDVQTGQVTTEIVKDTTSKGARVNAKRAGSKTGRTSKREKSTAIAPVRNSVTTGIVKSVTTIQDVRTAQELLASLGNLNITIENIYAQTVAGVRKRFITLGKRIPKPNTPKDAVLDSKNTVKRYMLLEVDEFGNVNLDGAPKESTMAQIMNILAAHHVLIADVEMFDMKSVKERINGKTSQVQTKKLKVVDA